MSKLDTDKLLINNKVLTWNDDIEDLIEVKQKTQEGKEASKAVNKDEEMEMTSLNVVKRTECEPK